MRTISTTIAFYTNIVENVQKTTPLYITVEHAKCFKIDDDIVIKSRHFPRLQRRRKLSQQGT